MPIEREKILVATSRVWKPDQERYEPFPLRPTYIEAIEEAGLGYEVVNPNMSMKKIKEKYRECDGLMLIGRNDWNARIYDQEPSPHNDAPDDEQDEREKELGEMALDDGKPMLGICGGEQGQGIILAQAYSVIDENEPLFIQHLPDLPDVPDVPHIKHDVGKYDELTENTHDVIIEEGTIAHEIFNATKIRVATGHHQALNKAALDRIKVLIVSGMSPDNIVEIIELSRQIHPFYFGVQTHPEVFPEIRGPIFKHLAKEMRTYASHSVFAMR